MSPHALTGVTNPRVAQICLSCMRHHVVQSAAGARVTMAAAAARTKRSRPRGLFLHALSPLMMLAILKGVTSSQVLRRQHVEQEPDLPVVENGGAARSSTPSSASITFPHPYVQSHPLDVCLHADSDQKCKLKTFKESEEAISGPTYLAGDGRVRPTGGYPFIEIKCDCAVNAAPAPVPLVYTRPEVLGHPVDYCLHKGKQCGQPAANAFCSSVGNAVAVDFLPDTTAKPTWIIGDQQVNSEGSSHKTFSSISCRQVQH